MPMLILSKSYAEYNANRKPRIDISMVISDIWKTENRFGISLRVKN